MKLVASQPLDHFPTDLAAVANDIVILTIRDGDAVLERYDAQLTQVWRRHLTTGAIALLAAQGNRTSFALCIFGPSRRQR